MTVEDNVRVPDIAVVTQIAQRHSDNEARASLIELRMDMIVVERYIGGVDTTGARLMVIEDKPSLAEFMSAYQDRRSSDAKVRLSIRDNPAVEGHQKVGAGVNTMRETREVRLKNTHSIDVDYYLLAGVQQLSE